MASSACVTGGRGGARHARPRAGLVPPAAPLGSSRPSWCDELVEHVGARAEQRGRRQSWLPGNAPSASAGMSPARSNDDFPLPDGPPTTSVRDDCSRRNKLVDSDSRPKKNAASSGWIRARPLYGHVVPGRGGAESDARGFPGGVLERLQRGRFPLGHRGESFLRFRCEPAVKNVLPPDRGGRELRRQCGALGRFAGEQVPDDGGRGVYVGGRDRSSAPTAHLLGDTEVRRVPRTIVGPVRVRSWSFARAEISHHDPLAARRAGRALARVVDIQRRSRGSSITSRFRGLDIAMDDPGRV